MKNSKQPENREYGAIPIHFFQLDRAERPLVNVSIHRDFPDGIIPQSAVDDIAAHIARVESGKHNRPCRSRGFGRSS